MEKKNIVVCSTMGLLGILSAATAFAAEAISRKVEFPTSSSRCDYPKNCALGLISSISLGIAKILVSCLERSDPHRPNYRPKSVYNTMLHLFLSAVSWITFFFTYYLLCPILLGHYQHGEETKNIKEYYCIPGLYAKVGVLSIVSVVVDIIDCLTRTRCKNLSRVVPAPPSQVDIAMEQPHIPP